MISDEIDIKKLNNIHVSTDSRRMNPHERHHPASTVLNSGTCSFHPYTLLYLLPSPLLFGSKSKTVYHVVGIYRYLKSQRIHRENKLYLGTWEGRRYREVAFKNRRE